MRVECLHGYFKFFPEKPSDASKLNGLYEAGLVKKDDYFTFEKLSEAEDYSLTGKMYLDTLCEVTFEGKPWEVMRENNIVFDFTKGISVLKSTVLESLSVRRSRFNFIENGLFVPGTITPNGRILSYSCFMKQDLRFFYDWVEYE